MSAWKKDMHIYSCIVYTYYMTPICLSEADKAGWISYSWKVPAHLELLRVPLAMSIARHGAGGIAVYPQDDLGESVTIVSCFWLQTNLGGGVFNWNHPLHLQNVSWGFKPRLGSMIRRISLLSENADVYAESDFKNKYLGILRFIPCKRANPCLLS